MSNPAPDNPATADTTPVIEKPTASTLDNFVAAKAISFRGVIEFGRRHRRGLERLANLAWTACRRDYPFRLFFIHQHSVLGCAA
jgi:hypothetical protein